MNVFDCCLSGVMKGSTYLGIRATQPPNQLCAYMYIGALHLSQRFIQLIPGIEVIKLEYSLKLKIKRNDWLLADTCPQPANHYALF